MNATPSVQRMIGRLLLAAGLASWVLLLIGV